MMWKGALVQQFNAIESLASDKRHWPILISWAREIWCVNFCEHELNRDSLVFCLECRDQFSYARKLSRLLIAKVALRTWPMLKDGGNGGDLRVTDLSGGKFITFLNWFRQRIGEIVDVTEPITLFHFSNIRCEEMIAEYIRNPTREISPMGMSFNHFGRDICQ